jgi:hypothetical protein
MTPTTSDLNSNRPVGLVFSDSASTAEIIASANSVRRTQSPSYPSSPSPSSPLDYSRAHQKLNRPAWEEDERRNECYGCNSIFSFIVRKVSCLFPADSIL